MIKYPHDSNLGETGHILAYNKKLQSIITGQSQKQKLEN